MFSCFRSRTDSEISTLLPRIVKILESRYRATLGEEHLTAGSWTNLAVNVSADR